MIMIHDDIVFVAADAIVEDAIQQQAERRPLTPPGVETKKTDQVGGAWATAHSDQEGVLPIHRACDSSSPTE
jgi:hypothetical protein